MYGPADRRETGMNAGAINFLIKRFDEQPVLESDLPQIGASVFQADDGHGGIAGAGFEHKHVLAFGYFHHKKNPRLFIEFIHRRPHSATNGR